MTSALLSIIEHYFPLHSVAIANVPFGLTNTTCYVTVKDQQYVARHYDRYTKTRDSLHLEIDVTTFLQSSKLSFNVPTFLPTQNGALYVNLSDGTLGVLVSFIQGTAPSLQTLNDAQSFGQIVGEISSTLSKYEIDYDTQYTGIPFTNVYELHPLANKAIVTSFFEHPPFPITDEQKNYYKVVLYSVESDLEALVSLPRQLIHHDLLVFNLLAVDHSIIGVLDFDFLSVDISFLEFVISLNHVLQMTDGSIEMAEAFIKGYKVFRNCSSDELRKLRTLTRLYHIAILHIYIGQYEAGKNISNAFTYILNQLIKRDRWLEQNKEHLDELLSILLQN